MPEQKGPLYFSGKLGNIVGYFRNGKHYYRSLPQHVKISKAAKLSGTDFGTASKAGKLIRTATKPHLDICPDGKHCNRLNKLLFKILHDESQPRGSRSFQPLSLCGGLTGHQFHLPSRISNMVRPEVVYDKHHLLLYLNFSTNQLQNIRHVIKTTHIEVKGIPILVDFSGNKHYINGTNKVLIDLMVPSPPSLSIPYIHPLAAETIIVMQMRAFIRKNGELQPSKNIKYQSAEIISVIPRPGFIKVTN